jgi:GNAT superfamily N-acetyltransferase
MRIELAAEQFESPDARALVSALDAHLSERYTAAQRFGPNLRPDQIDAGRGLFLVARVDGRAVGCGAVRLLGNSEAEVKRMWVDPAVRGQGIGRTLLARLESAACELGATRLVLETGIYQEEAIGLYQRSGFEPVECWGEYATSPTSLCMAKPIGSAEPAAAQS